MAERLDVDIGTFYASYPGQSVRAALRRMLPKHLDGARVLDIGCGTGRYFPFLSQLGATCLAGVDTGWHLLRRCRQRNPAVHLAQADAVRLPFSDGLFEVVMSLGLIEHFRDPVPVLAEFTRLVRPGGMLVLETPNVLNMIATLSKAVRSKDLAWEHWWGPWNLVHLIRQDTRLVGTEFASAVLCSSPLSRLVAKADRWLPGVSSGLVQAEGWWPFRYLGAMMFVAARRRETGASLKAPVGGEGTE